MSSKKYATPLRLEIKPSKILLLFLLGIHLVALILIYFLEFTLFLSISFYTFIILSAYFVINKYALLNSSKAIVKLIWDTNNEWILEAKNGETIQAELKQDSYIHPFISILIFNCRQDGVQANAGKFTGFYKLKLGFTCNVILLKDNVNENDFRRLRVRLKVGKPIEEVNL